MSAADLLPYGLAAAGWVVAAVLGVKLRGKAPPGRNGLGRR